MLFMQQASSSFIVQWNEILNGYFACQNSNCKVGEHILGRSNYVLKFTLSDKTLLHEP